MIALENVSKTYCLGGADVRALTDVSLDIEAGEYVVLVGPSGSGKSTLLHIIGCLDRPTAGTYRLGGVSVGELDINGLAEIRSRTVGFVFQRFHLMPRMTAIENVGLPMSFAGRSPGERRERGAALLARVGLADRAAHRPSELSGGEQQRVAIARALANGPRIIVADEPTGNLDSATAAEIARILDSLSAEGRTILIVTHDREVAFRARRIVEMADGRIKE